MNNTARKFFTLAILLITVSAFLFSTKSDEEKTHDRPLIPADQVRGVCVPAYIAKKGEVFDDVMRQALHNNLNTIVVTFKETDCRGDKYKYWTEKKTVIKDGKKRTITIWKKKLVPKHLGNVLYATSVRKAYEIGAVKSYIADVNLLRQRVWQNGLELGARVCLFGDYKYSRYMRENNILRQKKIIISNRGQSRWVRPRVVVNRVSGKKKTVPVVLTTRNKNLNDPLFSDPLNRGVLDYNVAILKELYDAGIRIFILDYVRMADALDEDCYASKNLFNHVALEQALKHIRREMREYHQLRQAGPKPLFSVSIFGRVMQSSWGGTRDPIGQNLITIKNMNYRVSPMDYTHLLPPEYHRKPYKGRIKYLSAGINRIGRGPFIPWVDTSALSFPHGQKVECVYQELKAVTDLGINAYIFWIPSGHPKEFRRLFKALEKFNREKFYAEAI